MSTARSRLGTSGITTLKVRSDVEWPCLDKDILEGRWCGVWGSCRLRRGPDLTDSAKGRERQRQRERVWVVGLFVR